MMSDVLVRMRSGRTMSPPASTIICASMAARAAPSGPPSSPNVARRHGERFGHRFRETAKGFGARWLEQLVGGVRDQAAEHHDVWIGDGDEIGDGHADVAGRVSDNRNRDAVAFARRVENLLHVNCREIAACHVEHARSIARLDAPHEPADDARGSDFRLQRAEPAVVLPLDRIEGQPCGGTRQAVRPFEWNTADHHAGMNAVGCCQRDDMLRPLPRHHASARQAPPRSRE